MEEFFNTKKSQGHIEVIISFVIFIGFVLTFFLFLNPLNRVAINPSALDDIQAILFDNLSSPVKYVPVRLHSIQDACFEINDALDLGNTTIVFDSNGKILTSQLNNGKISISNSGEEKFYKIYSSDLFEGSTLSLCIALDSSDYGFGVLSSENRIFFENLKSLQRDYISDYDGLRKNLKIRSNFDFVIFDLNRYAIMNDTISVHKLKGENILARDIPIRVINETAGENEFIFSLRVW